MKVTVTKTKIGLSITIIGDFEITLLWKSNNYEKFIEGRRITVSDDVFIFKNGDIYRYMDAGNNVYMNIPFTNELYELLCEISEKVRWFGDEKIMFELSNE